MAYLTYDQIQKEKDLIKVEEKRTHEWFILLAILFHILILYIWFPKGVLKRMDAAQSTQNFMELSRIKPPPPPPEQIQEEMQQKKKKVIVKPVPQPQTEEPEPVVMDDINNVELVYDASDIDLAPPEAPQDGPLRVGGDVKAPTLVKRIEPVYPEIARRARIQGMVILEAIINKEGSVTDVKIIKSLNSLLDEAAMTAVKQWKFDPGTQNDIPVDVIMNLTVIFQIS